VLDLPERVRDLAGSLDVHLSAESIGMLAAALEFDPARRPRAAVRLRSRWSKI
jgi:hypothetical protein